MPTIPFTPKLRRFIQNDVVLGILGFSFFFKGKLKLKKGGGGKEEIGLAGATPYGRYGL
jgi:hypothetical protein